MRFRPFRCILFDGMISGGVELGDTDRSWRGWGYGFSAPSDNGEQLRKEERDRRTHSGNTAIGNEERGSSEARTTPMLRSQGFKYTIKKPIG